MRHTIEELQALNIAVHCKTLTDFMMMRGWLMGEGASIDEGHSGSETCLVVSHNNKTASVIDKKSCEELGIDIITAEQQLNIFSRKHHKLMTYSDVKEECYKGEWEYNY